MQTDDALVEAVMSSARQQIERQIAEMREQGFADWMILAAYRMHLISDRATLPH